jgi:hypothetical protein
MLWGRRADGDDGGALDARVSGTATTIKIARQPGRSLRPHNFS